MLTVKFAVGDELREAYEALSIAGEPRGSNFVMYDDLRPVALMRMRIIREAAPVCEIERIRYADGVDEDDKTFFLHTMFFKLLGGAPIKLRIEGTEDEFGKFGFEKKGEFMEIYSPKINLYYNCGEKR